MTNEVTLPWPTKALSPNARVHWRVKSKAAQAYRQACRMLAREAKLQAPDTELIHLHLEFYPPTRRARDDDNLTAMFKSGRDGIADALGINDSRFRTHAVLMTEAGGKVKLRMEPGVISSEGVQQEVKE